MKDQINETVNSHHAAAHRPRLISAVDEHSRENWRILHQLEHGKQPLRVQAMQHHWTIEHWIVSLSIAIALICVAAWYLHPRPEHRSMSSIPPAADPAQRTPPAPLLPLAGATAAARIISTPPLVLPAPAPLGARQPDPVAPRRPNAMLQRVGERKLPTDSATLRPLGERGNELRDRDAALLAALVAHEHSAAPPEVSATRDIVERQASESSARLIQRCLQLGAIEGMLCRSRICAGRWDSDAACRQPQAPLQIP